MTLTTSFIQASVIILVPAPGHPDIPMKSPRVSISWFMVAVAIVALNFAAIRALSRQVRRGPPVPGPANGQHPAARGDRGIPPPSLAGFRPGFRDRRRGVARRFPFWASENPWTFLHYFEPPIRAVDRRVEVLFPRSRGVIIYGIGVVAFAIPHAIVGVIGGCLTAKGWAILTKRRPPQFPANST